MRGDLLSGKQYLDKTVTHKIGSELKQYYNYKCAMHIAIAFAAATGVIAGVADGGPVLESREQKTSWCTQICAPSVRKIRHLLYVYNIRMMLYDGR